jgi:hypothetical protein
MRKRIDLDLKLIILRNEANFDGVFYDSLELGAVYAYTPRSGL